MQSRREEDGRPSVLFAVLHAQQFLYPAPTIYLRGLDEQGLYRVKTIDDKLAEKIDVVSGSYLAHRESDLKLSGDFGSTAVLFEKVEWIRRTILKESAQAEDDHRAEDDHHAGR